LVAVKLDGTRTERICHLYAIKFDYIAESHGVPSPNGLRAMWASDWENNDYPVQAYVAEYDSITSGVTYSLNVNVNGNGSVSPQNGTYTDGENVNIEATPDAGWQFDSWSGDYTGTDNPISIIMNSNKNITATFFEESSGTTTTISSQILQSSDDAEENIGDGSVNVSSSDLELVEDGSSGAQIVGLRFNNILVPQGAEIDNAYIQFAVDEQDSDPTSLTISGQASNNAVTFNENVNDISDRPTTTTNILWEPLAWNTVGNSGTEQQTSDLSDIIYEITNRSGWQSNNSLVLFINGTGERTAESYDGDENNAPKLFITYNNTITDIKSDNKETKYFACFPNPAKNFVQIESLKIEINNLQIIDITGKLVKQINLKQVNSCRIDISGLDNGIYTLQINNKYFEKFVKE